jgi:uncharacterized protein DUF4439
MSTMTRRTLLACCAAVLAGGCTAGTATSSRPRANASSPRPVPNPLADDVAAEVDLCALYDAAIGHHPSLAARLRPIRTDHGTQLTALLATGKQRQPRPTSATPIPASAAATLQTLAAAETAAVSRRTAHCLTVSRPNAALLGSIAASDASHLVPLGGTPSVATPPAPGAPHGSARASEVTGLQSVLAAENAVRWGYDIVGGQVHTALQPTVRLAQNGHVAVQDLLQTAIRARRATPVAADAGYTLPFAVSGQVSALRLAADLEERSTASWHYLLGATDDASLRRFAAAGLQNAAVRATQWRARSGAASTVALPGA